jgi:hypothetical protein
MRGVSSCWQPIDQSNARSCPIAPPLSAINLAPTRLCAAIDVVTHPPGAGLEGRDQINPGPDFAQHAVTCRHRQEKETGNCRELHEVRVAAVPAKTPGACPAVIPYNGSCNGYQYSGSYDAKHEQAKRKNGRHQALFPDYQDEITRAMASIAPTLKHTSNDTRSEGRDDACHRPGDLAGSRCQ